MPSKVLPSQTGNSCAAHCTVVAAAELLGINSLTKSYAEEVVWELIRFRTGEGPVTDDLASKECSDPRRMVQWAGKLWPAIETKLVCDETRKGEALKYIADGRTKLGLDGLFTMMKGSGAVASLDPAEGVYYNASYLMLRGGKATGGKFEGMHNILVTRSGGKAYYYNPNEDVPAWKVAADWTTLEGQNDGNYSYVFTGVCVRMTGK